MVLSIQPGVYAIRNVAENDYLYPENGYANAGRKIFINSWVQDGSIKWSVVYNQMGGTYWIKNYSSGYYLSPGIPQSRGDPPQLELNNIPFEWVIGETPNGNGFFIVKADEQDQVVEADKAGPGVFLNDLDRSRAQKRQIWTFEWQQ